MFQLNCRTWCPTNGLPLEDVIGIAQAKEGYLYIGTSRELLRYDGHEFKDFPVNSAPGDGKDIRQLLVAPDGSLRLVQGDGTVAEFDGNQWRHVFSAEVSNKTGLNVLVTHEGITWFGSRSGWGRSSAANGQGSVLQGGTNIEGVLSMCEDPGGGVWLGTSGQGLFLWRDEKVVAHYSDSSLTNHGIRALAAEANRLWIGTPQGLYSLSDGQITPVPVSFSVSTLLVDRHGSLWIGTAERGLVRGVGGQFSVLSKADGLAGDSVTSLFEDAEGNIWVGTKSGLSELTDVKFPILSSRDGIASGSCHAVVADPKGGLWISAAGGLTYLKGTNVTNYRAGDLGGNDYVKLSFVARNGDLYIEDGDKTISVLSGGTVVQRITNSVWISAIAEDSESVIVGRGTTHALCRLKGGEFVPFKYSGDEPEYYWIHNLLCAQDGAIWVASGNGVYRVQAGQVQHWGSASGLSGDTALCMTEDADGTIWVGLASGLARIRDGQVMNIRHQDGLPPGWIHSIVTDDDGNFWCASNDGVFRIHRKSLDAFVNGTVSRVSCDLFEGSDAMKRIARTDQEHSGCRTLDGRIWFPSPLGVMMINPGALLTNRVAPRVHVLRVLADGREFPVTEGMIVPAGARQLEIDYAALSFTSPEGIRYRHRMEGVDPAWIESGNLRKAVYSVLKPGPYAFQVIAANADGVWNSTGDRIRVNVRPYAYQTAAFYILCGGLALLILACIYLLRVRQLKTQQRLLQELREQLEAQVRQRTSELARSVSLLNATIESTADGLLVVDRNQRVVTCNRKFIDIWRVPSDKATTRKDEELLGFALSQVKDQTAFLARVRELYERPDVESYDLVELKDDRVLERYSVPQWLGSEIVGRVWSFRDITDRERIERELVGSRNFLDRIINNISFPIHVKDCRHRWLLVNDAACRFMGLSREELIGKSVRETIGGPAADAILATDMEVVETGREIISEDSFADRSGKQRSIVSRKSLYVDERGERLIVGVTEDVTERKHAEKELRWKTAFLEALIASSIDGVLVVSDEGKKIYQNQRTLDLWQIPREISEDPDDSRQVQCVMQRVKDPEQFVNEVKRLYDRPNEKSHDEIEFKDGTILDRHSYPVVGQDGTRYGRIWQFRDVTERKRAEAALAYERDLLRSLLDSTPDAIYFKDLDSRFLRCSRSMARQFQVDSPESLIGKTDFDYFSKDHAQAAFEDERSIIRTGESLIGKIEEEKRTDGTVSWALTSKMVLRNVAGEIIGTLGISKDITPIKEAEARLESAHRQLLEISRQAGMAEVATSVLHNVGNVLNSINVSVSLVSDAVKGSKIRDLERLSALIEEHRSDLPGFFGSHPKGKLVPDYLQKLSAYLVQENLKLMDEIGETRKNVEHVKDIVMMQQNYARVSGVNEKVKVLDLVEDALRMNSGGLLRHEVEVVKDFPQTNPEITVDRHKVLQILINLVRNAKYACGDSGRNDRRMTVGIRQSDGRISISVTDNGIGIPPENMTRIFNHGFTTRKGGHGFGLHSGALAAKELGGELIATSEGLGKGATFCLELPLSPPKADSHAGF